MNRKKTERVYIRLSDNDKKMLSKRARIFGLSISQYVHKMALQRDPFLIAEENLKELRDLQLSANEIKRSLNLHHEKKMQHRPFFNYVKGLYKRITK
jgi:uncharacterized protein (DUF1778 family)